MAAVSNVEPLTHNKVHYASEIVRDVVFHLDDMGYGFIADIVALATPLPTLRMPTAYTIIENNIVQIYVNVDFFNSLNNVSEQSYVLTHELCHFLFGDLMKLESFKDQEQAFNQAADCVINDYLSSHYNLEEPEGLLHGHTMVGYDCADKVVEDVIEDIPEVTGGGEGEGQPGDGGGQPGDGICDMSASGMFGNNDDLLDRVASVARKHGAEEIAEAMEDARSEEGSSHSGDGFALVNGLPVETLPANWFELVQSLNLEYHRRKGRFMAQTGKVQSSFRMPNRPLGYMYPEHFIPSEMDVAGHGNRRSLIKPKVLIAVDSSGSIGRNMLNKFLGVLQALDTSKVDAHCITFSSYVKEYDLTSSGRQTIASGGTSFARVLEWTRKFPQDEVDGVILITDGYDRTPKITDKKERDKWLMVLSPMDSVSHKEFRKVDFRGFFDIPQ